MSRTKFTINNNAASKGLIQVHPSLIYSNITIIELSKKKHTIYTKIHNSET